MSQKNLDDKHTPPLQLPIGRSLVPSCDNPDDVKARLKCWAQAVACTVQLCS
ncbi:hypothetical protein AtNW77_Chr3g0181951 [Arabidopsis thaliana]